jgi:Ras-related protein Rab-23
MIEEMTPTMKIIVVGNGKVGKTTLTIKYVKGKFTSDYKKTLGVDFLNIKRYIKNIEKEIEFYIWDTAGQDYYNSITKRYYKGADAALIVFAINDKDSFDNIISWYDKIYQECDNIPIILVMSKIDLKHEAVVSDIEAENLAKKLNIDFMKVSSKDNIMVNEVFEKLAIIHFQNLNLESNNIIEENNYSNRSGKKNGFQINSTKKEKKKGKNCCK